MSLRKGIYKHQFSAASSATPIPSDSTKHWVYTFADPSKTDSQLTQTNNSTPIPTVGSSTSLNTSNGDDNQENLNEKFYMKTWVSKEIADGEDDRNQVISLFKDCEDDDRDAVIDLDKYTYLPVETETSDQPGNAMSMSDIKSAVGNAGAGNSLFSSSAAHALKKDEESNTADSDVKQETEELSAQRPEEIETPKVEELSETPHTANGTSDVDGDIKME